MESNCINIIRNFIASSSGKIKCEETSKNNYICSNTLNQFCQPDIYDKKILTQISSHSKYFDYVSGEKNNKKFILIGHNKIV